MVRAVSDTCIVVDPCPKGPQGLIPRVFEFESRFVSEGPQSPESNLPENPPQSKEHVSATSFDLEVDSAASVCIVIGHRSAFESRVFVVRISYLPEDPFTRIFLPTVSHLVLGQPQSLADCKSKFCSFTAFSHTLLRATPTFGSPIHQQLSEFLLQFDGALFRSTHSSP